LVWKPLIELSEKIEQLFDAHLTQYPITEPIDFVGWKDTYWKSDQIRKCHLKTIDNRDTQRLWLMHINIFPKTTSNIPILGFDIVAGQNKITGSFFDFSPVCDEHPFHDYFEHVVKDLEWNKPRELPDWANAIFSKNMIAVGNLRSSEEIQQLSDVSYHLIEYYLENAAKFEVNAGDFKPQQNFYCSQQKLNPHLHRSILAMGISEEDKDRYIEKVLFEEV